MTMPSKGRREITVNDIVYHYKVRPYATVIQNTVTNKVTTVPREYRETILPRYVEEMIVERKL